MAVDVEIRGIKETQAKLKQVGGDLTGSPMEQGMGEATMLVTRNARIYAPVDTGRLRASIAPEVRIDGKEVIGVVGSNVKYAAFQEIGTSRMPGKRYLQKAFEENLEKIKKLIGDVVAKIVKK